MRIERTSADPKAYIDEFANISMQTRKIFKNPQGELENVQLRNIIMTVVMAVAAVWSFWFYSTINNGIILVLSGMLLGLLVPYIKTIVSVSKYKKNIDLNDGYYEVTGEGVSHTTERASLKIFWPAIRAVRVYKHSLVLILVDAKTAFLVMPAERKDDLLGFMNEHGIDKPLIESHKYGKDE